jgi:hypothetical protein
MHFYVDESGQSGLNLFDSDQPVLYYGVLSSPLDLNVSARPFVESMRRILGVDRLHASELGIARLSRIAHQLDTIQRKNKITFDVYRILKKDHAVICFFDQVFDQGLNKAVPWTSYWTPLRYVLLLKVSYLFDDVTLKKAWQARTMVKVDAANSLFVEVCETLLSRIHELPDARSREVVGDALKWAIKYPGEIHYNIYSKNERLQISPNLIGFQSVLHGIANRLKKDSKEAVSIVVDRQLEFNRAQEWISSIFRSSKNFPTTAMGPGLPVIDMANMPEVPITCTPGTDNVGLELVDIYLWLFKRLFEGKHISDPLRAVIAKQISTGMTDEISLEGISNRWEKYFSDLPEPEGEKLQKARELLAIDEARRKPNLSGL